MALFKLISFLSLTLVCCGSDELLPRVMVNVITTNVNAFNATITIVSNHLDHSKFNDRVAQVDGFCETNGNTYSVTWFTTMTTSNAAWMLWQFASTNAFNPVIKVRAHYHLCPCGPPTNPPAWGPCTIYSLSGYVETNR